jgi:flagella basal body P-ring formation protein FlgA
MKTPWPALGALLALASALPLQAAPPASPPADAPGCLEVAAERISAADLARADGAWSKAAPAWTAGLAPLPGATRWIGEAEMLRWKKRAGIEASRTAGICVVRRGSPVPAAAVEEAVGRAVAALQRGGRQLKWTVLDYETRRLPEGSLSLAGPPPLAGAERPEGRPYVWRGRWAPAGGGRSTPFWVRLRIECREAGIVLARDLPARALVEAKDLKIVPQAGCEAGEAALLSVREAAGRRLRRSLPAGTRLAAYALEPLYLVERGQAVRVEAEVAGAKVSVAGTAAASGSLGDRVPFRTAPKSGLRWGRVAGPSLIAAQGAATP